MPVLFPCRNKDYIPRADGYLLLLSSDNTLALSNNQYLFNIMGVELISYTMTKIYLLYKKSLAQLCAHNRLHGNRAGKQ